MGSRRKRKSVLPSWFAEDVKTIDQAKQGLTSNMELFVPLLVSYLKFVSFLIIPADVVFFVACLLMTIKQVVQLDFDQRLVIDVGLLLGGLVGYLVLKRIERRVAPKGWLKDTSFDTFN